jgi:hypothetical protein
MICLGSLRDIADELGLGGDTNLIRRAIRQNAFAAITARLTYTSADGRERRLEADFTRYSVIFTGEKLPLRWWRIARVQRAGSGNGRNSPFLDFGHPVI